MCLSVCLQSAIYKLENKAILRDFLQWWKVECRADSLVPMRFAVFPAYVSEVLRPPRKSDARSYKVLRLSRKIIFPKLKIWCSKMQPLSENKRPDLLTSLMNMSLLLGLTRKMNLSRSSSNAPRLPTFLDMRENPHVLLTFEVHNPLCRPRKTTSALFRHPKFQKCSDPGVHVVEFDLEMCFAPQRRALFRHLNFQKCSDPGVFVHFDLEMCFAPQRRALFRHHNFQKCSPTLVCFVHVDYFDLEMCFAPHWRAIFAFLIWPHGSAPAALASLLFDPPEPQIVGKTQCFATLLPFRAPASSFFSLFPFSDLLSSALLFSDASHCPHLCFSICPYCWKFDF